MKNKAEMPHWTSRGVWLTNILQKYLFCTSLVHCTSRVKLSLSLHHLSETLDSIVVPAAL